MLPEFNAFPKIPRLFREIVITEKLDGTNAQIVVSDDGNSIVAIGSRNKWITPEDDNFGFARWVRDNEQELLKLGPGHHFGEWWGAGIQRRYGLSEKRFSLFNTKRWNAENPPPACCHVVPVLRVDLMNTQCIHNILGELREAGSLAAPGFMDPEGIMIYHTAANQYFKYTFDDNHKG
jgi:hypothetical protein